MDAVVIRTVLAGVWATAVTLVSAYVGASLQLRQDTEQGKPERLEIVKGRLISVPVVADGGVEGYVLAQFTYSVRSEVLAATTLPVEPILADEAFKVIYDGQGLDMRRGRKQDLTQLTQAIARGANRRLGAELVTDVLMESMNYVSKTEVRGRAPKANEIR